MKKLLCLILAVMIICSCTACGSTKESADETPAAKADDSIETIPMSDEAKAMQETLTANGTAALFTEEYYPALLEMMESTDYNVFPDVTTNAQLSHFSVSGHEVYTLGADNATCIVFYLHGGAYAFGIDPAHIEFCDKLVERLDAKVYMPLYPLTPHATYEDGYAFLDAVYEQVLSEGKPIYMMGDSAGGGFSLAYAEYLRDKQQPMPDKLVLFSPWTDISMENPNIKALEEVDPDLRIYGTAEIGKLWAGDLDTKDPLVSPIYGALEDLPPIMLFTGTAELMYPDVTKLYQMLKEAGNDVTLIYGENLWHVFELYDIPEAEEAMDRVVAFCK